MSGVTEAKKDVQDRHALVQCSSCNADVHEDWERCQNCGEDLEADAPKPREE